MVLLYRSHWAFISLWSVRCCFRLLDVVHTAQFSYHSTLKVKTLVTVNAFRYTKLDKPIMYQCWSFVGIAWVNLVKISEMTSTFSRPSDEGSKTVKSIVNISIGAVATKLPMCVCSLGCLSLARHQRSHLSYHPCTPYVITII